MRRGLSMEGLAWAFRATESGNWHPITWLSHMLDCQLFGLTPGGPHLVNALWHAVNTSLLFLGLRRMTGMIWRSAFVASLFALHPLHVESVAWISERKDVLSAFFWFLTLWFYAKYVEESKVQSPKSKVAYALALFFFALGLMSKPMTVTLPFTLLLLDFWPLNRLSKVQSPKPKVGVAASVAKQLWTLDFGLCTRLFLEKIPFFALSGALCVITFFAQHKEGAATTQEQMPLAWRAGNALMAYGRYIQKMFWPADLTFLYPHPGKWPSEIVIGSALFLVAVSVVVIWLGRRYPYVLAGWLWYLGTLVPVIGLVQVGVQSMADRFSYIPFIGLFIILVWGSCDIANKFRLPKAVLVSGAVAILAACLAVTLHQLPYWKNSAVLYHRALEVAMRDAVYRKAMQTAPFYADLHLGLCTDLAEGGEPEKAIPYLQELVQVVPRYDKIHVALGSALILQSKWEEAARELMQAGQLNPKNDQPHIHMAKILLARNRPNEALEEFSMALKLNPDNADTHFAFAVVLEQLGRREPAITHYREALRLQPDFAEAKQQLYKLAPR